MKDKTVVITGASSGIGAALATTLSQRGARVVLAARRAPELAQVAARCENETEVVTADVRVRADVERLRDRAIARFDHIDVWVNNAGRGISRQVSQLSDEDFDEMMAVNVKSALYGMQAVLPHFIERKSGHIINVSSMLGRVPFVTVRSAYNAAKHALNALTANLRMELREEHPTLKVSCVMPGVVATDFGLSAKHGGADSRSFPGAQPVDEVAELIAELIVKPRAELYTRAAYRDMVVGYYSTEDMDELESRPPFSPSPKR